MGSGFAWLLRALAAQPLGVRERAFQPAGMAIVDLPPAGQAEVVRALQQWNYQPLQLVNARLRLVFIPAGRYVWYPPATHFSTEQYFALPLASGRSPEEALRAAQRIDPGAQAEEIHRSPGALTLFLNYGGRLSSQGRPE